MRTRALPAIFTTLLAGALLPSGAGAAGGPVMPIGTSGAYHAGLEDPSGDATYYTLAANGETTALRVSDTPDRGGRTLNAHYYNGNLFIPTVAIDGTTAGISEDGGTLVLIKLRRRFPEPQTKFRLLSPRTLRPIRTIVLRGDFVFDSISPDGDTLYLVHYVDPADPNVYEVRAYDVEARRLLPDPIIDTRLAPQVMRGMAMTRASSPDGAWAYTLYDGGGGHHAEPFVHALDTENARALCIDLPMLADLAFGRLRDVRLAPSEDGATIGVLDGEGAAIATIETGSWEVTEGAPQPAEADAAGIGALPFVAAGGALLVALLVVGGATRRAGR